MFKTFLIICAFSVYITSNNVFASMNLDNYENLINKLSTDDAFVKDYQENVDYLLSIEPNYFDYVPTKPKPFDCIIDPSPSVPTSVHQLRPSDIKAVAALGDSLTAALGESAKTVLGLLIENRGKSWSIGGDKELEKLVTLPNILKKFNRNLKGASSGFTVAPLTKKGKGLNVAVSGQEANHLRDQANILVQRFKEQKDFDYLNEWKLVTLFIGGNDLCDFCKDKALHSPETYTKDIQDALDILQKELPRTFVNLVSVLRVEEVKKLNKGLVCNVLHKFECPCAAFPKDEAEERELKQYFEGYLELTQRLIDTGRYDVNDNFTVVVQPFLTELSIPRLKNDKIDFSYFAPDCFHFSTKGHSSAAIGLWNNMLEPVGQKSKTWSEDEIITCPTKQRPYFATAKN